MKKRRSGVSVAETYTFEPLNWNSCSHWSKCDNSVKVYNKLGDKRLQNLMMTKGKNVSYLTIHNLETNLIFLIPTANPLSWKFMILKQYRNYIYKIKYGRLNVSVVYFPLVMSVMKVFSHHFILKMDKVQLFKALDCWFEMTWLVSQELLSSVW